jgi:hypothetical protein
VSFRPLRSLAGFFGLRLGAASARNSQQTHLTFHLRLLQLFNPFEFHIESVLQLQNEQYTPWTLRSPIALRSLEFGLPLSTAATMSSMQLSQLRKWMLESPPVEWGINQLRELLIGALRHGPIPQHVAFVMDGNRRFARSHKIETVEGHNLGFEALARVI